MNVKLVCLIPITVMSYWILAFLRRVIVAPSKTQSRDFPGLVLTTIACRPIGKGA